ncbi:hypothetical protein [Methanococcoides sp. NM1]|uniref:hypothetical protein n=1 Tax=Methanococcoides sp. NM1 TaxID=1201013 RepID=UPI001083E143|nr:hypothetical protein [Methanococcoides sp. NM1]
MKRRYIHVDGVVYIGKEANSIDEQELNVKQAQVFINKQEIMQRILSISQKQAESLGVSRSTFQGIKKRIRETGDVNLYTPAVRRVVEN